MGRLILAELPGPAEEIEAVARVTTTNPVAFSPDGSRVVVRVGDRAEVHNLDVAEPPVRFPLPGSTIFANQTRPPTLQQRAFFAFSGDGSRVAVGVGQAVAVHYAASGDRRFWEGKYAAPVTGVAFDRLGRWVFVGTHDGTLLAYRADRFEPDRTVTLRWGLGPIHALAAGLDGETVYTAVDEGVKAWPVARLLEGL